MKKFLSLVLALVMTMSLVTVAGASFTDADDVNYDAAVEVMTALEVVGGYADGSFNPKGTLTRGAAAKIICNILVGPETAADLVANTAPYSDVPANHTFAGYIAYCAEKGIISGYADGTFRPAATLTGYAFVKMLLTGLGYDQTIEGYTGTNWAINVAEDAVEKKLTDGLDGKFVGNKAITREEACLFALNALMAKTVKYESKGSNIVIGGVEINTAAGDAKDTEKDLKETNFKSLTKLTKDVVDSLGRPSVTWKYEKKEIGTYAADADYTYVNEFDKAVYNKLVKDKVIDGKEVVYYNGSAHKDYKTAKDLFVAGKAAVNGWTIEMFDIDDDDTIDVIAMTEEYFAEVGKFTAANAKKDKPAEVVLTVYEWAKKEGVNLTIVDDEDKDNDAYDMLAGYKKGDYVAVTLKQGWESKGADGVLAVSDVKAVSGKVEKVSAGNKSKNYEITVKMGGEVYSLNNECVAKPAKAGDEGTLYLDAQGCVLGWIADKEATTDKAIAISDVYTTLDGGKLVTKVEGYLSNGETTTLTLVKGATAPDAYKVYTYAEKDDTDTYTFDEVKNTTKGDGETVKFEKATITGTTKTLDGAYFADGVKFIFVDATNKKIEVKDGVQKIEKETQVYYTVSVDDGKNYVTAVYVMAAPAGGVTTADDLIFIVAETGAFTSLVDDKAKTFYTYEAYINGKEVEDFYSANNGMGAGFYKNVVDNKTGAYILKDKAFSDTSDLVVNVNVKVDAYAAGIVNGKYGVAGAVVVDLSDSFDGIEAGAYISMLVDPDTNDALYVYVTEGKVVTTPAGA